MKKLSIALLLAVACANFKSFSGGGNKEQAKAHKAEVQKENKAQQQKQVEADRKLAEQVRQKEHLDADERIAVSLQEHYNKTSDASINSLTTTDKENGATKAPVVLPKAEETMDTKHSKYGSTNGISKTPPPMDMKIEVVFPRGSKGALAHAAVQNVRSQTNHSSSATPAFRPFSYLSMPLKNKRSFRPITYFDMAWWKKQS